MNKKILLLAILAFVLGMGFSKALANWSPPTTNPTAGNAPTPISVSDLSQYKGGALGVGGLFRAFSNVLIDGNLNFSASSTGAIRVNVPGKLNATQVCINGDCRGSWVSGGGGGTTVSNNGSTLVAGEGLSLSDGTLSLNINNGTVQTCPSGQKADGLSPLGIISCSADAAGGVGGSNVSGGTIGNLAYFTSPTTLGNSALTQNNKGALYTGGALGVGGRLVTWGGFNVGLPGLVNTAQVFVRRPNLGGQGVYVGNLDPAGSTDGFSTNFSANATHFSALINGQPVFSVVGNGDGSFKGNLTVGGTATFDNVVTFKNKLELWPLDLQSNSVSGGVSLSSSASGRFDIMFGNKVGALFNANGNLTLPGINDVNGGHIRAGRLEIVDGNFVTTIDDSVLTTQDVNLQDPKWSITKPEQTAPTVNTTRTIGAVFYDEWNRCPTGYFISGIRFGKKTAVGATAATTVIECSKL